MHTVVSRICIWIRDSLNEWNISTSVSKKEQARGPCAHHQQESDQQQDVDHSTDDEADLQNAFRMLMDIKTKTNGRSSVDRR